MPAEGLIAPKRRERATRSDGGYGCQTIGPTTRHPEGTPTMTDGIVHAGSLNTGSTCASRPKADAQALKSAEITLGQQGFADMRD
jgi:hypothetical protein